MNLGQVHKTRFWYLLGVSSKFSDEHPLHFDRGVAPRAKNWQTTVFNRQNTATYQSRTNNAN